MTVTFRKADRRDVPRIVAMLADDMLGQGRESGDLVPYYDAFDQMGPENGNQVFVGEQDGEVIATYQLIFISGLSLRATRRAQIESVRVDATLRGQGIGAQLMRDAETRAREAGCGMMQFSSNAARDKAHSFYERMGYTPSHVGFKRRLDGKALK